MSPPYMHEMVLAISGKYIPPSYINSAMVNGQSRDMILYWKSNNTEHSSKSLLVYNDLIVLSRQMRCISSWQQILMTIKTIKQGDWGQTYPGWSPIPNMHNKNKDSHYLTKLRRRRGDTGILSNLVDKMRGKSILPSLRKSFSVRRVSAEMCWSNIPAGTRRNNNVFITSKRRRRRRFDVMKTLSLRH